MNMKIALSFMALSSLLSPIGAGAVDTFDYANYPANVVPNRACSADDFRVNRVFIDGQEVAHLGQGHGRVHPGTQVKVLFQTNNAACNGVQPFLALYANVAAGGATTDVTQTLVATNGGGQARVGYESDVNLTVPDTFCGPFQLDLVLGQPLPRVGKNANVYGGMPRFSNGFPGSDDRKMVVDWLNDTIHGTARNGICPAIDRFSDLASQTFDYANYPFNQITFDTNKCSSNFIEDNGSELGFWLNGVKVANPSALVLQPGDDLEYRFKVRNDVSSCAGQKVSLALYRNPNGAFGLYRARNQRLVVSDTTESQAGVVKTLKIAVPDAWDGGWQLDVAIGNPLPIIGDIGATYSSSGFYMLRFAAHGFIGKNQN